jgi:hypothetical protein
MPAAPWCPGERRKSSYSDQGNGCVEALLTKTGVHVADTKQHGTGPVLRVDHAAWRAFVAELDARPR